MIKASHIAIIIVQYHPLQEDVQFAAHLGKQYHTVLIDNSNENKGIAEAQNQGLQHILNQKGITHVVFLDQDSRVTDDYPLAIAKEFDNIAQRKKLSILGPSIKNNETGKEYKSVIHHDRLTDSDFIPRREIISSGSCTTIACLRDVGLNDARLFIDYVDFEWCWRARAKGYTCGITPRLGIIHHVGRKTICLFGYIIIISTPSRYFYQFRNYLWLFRRDYVPLQWKIATGVKCIARLVYFPLLIHTGVECWKNMIRGIKAGMRT